MLFDIKRSWLLYSLHRNHSRSRNIPFLLSFEEWLGIWIKSRKFHLRGTKKHQYVMARYGDTGPYVVGNVNIILSGENVRESSIGKPRSEEIRKRMSLGRTGLKREPFSEEWRNNLSKALKGRKFSQEHLRKKSEAQRGKKHSDETRKKLSEIAKKRESNKRKAKL